MLTNENFKECFRNRDISGIIYFIRLNDATTYCDEAGNPVKLNFEEARKLIDAGGEGLEAIIAARSGTYAKPAPKTNKPKKAKAFRGK